MGNKSTKSKPTNSPLDIFFNLAPKDPVLKSLFDYCLMWIIFGGFGYIFLNNIYMFFTTFIWSTLGWACVTGGILYFNYSALVGMRATHQLIKKMHNTPPDKGVDDMMDSFEIKPKKKNKTRGRNEKI